MAQTTRQRAVKLVTRPRSSFDDNWTEVPGATVTLPKTNDSAPYVFFKSSDTSYTKTKKRLVTGENGNVWIAFQSVSSRTANGAITKGLGYGAVISYARDLSLNTYYRVWAESDRATYDSFISTSDDITVSAYSHNSAYPPYIKDVLEDIVVSAINMSPSAFVDATKSIRLSWDISTDIGEDGNARTQKSATVEWTSGNTTKTYNVTTAQYYDVPANTFPANSSFKWRVKIISDDDIDSGWSDWVTVSTTDVPGEVRNLSPSNIAVDGDDILRISWVYNNTYGTAPTGYDIEMSTNGGTSFSCVKSEKTANCYADIPAGTVPAGNIQYRVRAYSQSNKPSEWATAEITVRARPATPSITSINASTDKPIVSWESVGQEAYELTITDRAGNVLYSTFMASPDRSHKLTQRLDNGTYTATLKIVNEYNLESLPASRQFTVNVTKPSIPTISGESYGKYNRLFLNSSTARAVLIRDGVAIADVSGMSTYDDYAAASTSVYILRSLTDTAFRDSVPLTISSSGRRARISSASDPSVCVELIYRANSLPGRTTSYENEYSLLQFAGRPLPVAEFGEHCGRNKTLSYSLHSREDVEILRRLNGGAVLWRDSVDRFFAVMSELQVTAQRKYVDVSFKLTEIDYNEAVEYE